MKKILLDKFDFDSLMLPTLQLRPARVELKELQPTHCALDQEMLLAAIISVSVCFVHLPRDNKLKVPINWLLHYDNYGTFVESSKQSG